MVSWTGNFFFPPPPFAPENLVSRDEFGRPVPSRPVPSRPVPRPPAHHSPHSVRLNENYGAYSRRIPPIFRGRVHLFISPTTIGSVPSLSDPAYRWHSLPRIRRHRGSTPQGSSSNNGCCLFRFHHGPNNVRLSLNTPTLLCLLYNT